MANYDHNFIKMLYNDYIIHDIVSACKNNNYKFE